VRVLLDEQLPRQLAPYLAGHDVRTVQQQGWAGLQNGELLTQAAVAGFEIFLTSDQNLEFQQNLKNSRLFIVVLIAVSNAIEDLLPLVPAALAAMEEPRPSQALRIDGR
jgi:hypothetical protein